MQANHISHGGVHMNHERYGNAAEIVVALAAVFGFFTIFWQLRDAARVLSFNGVTQYAKLTEACTTEHNAEVAEAAQIKVWDNLCKARKLSQEIVINDFLRATGASQVNLEAAKQLSIQLEDGLVRELGTQAAVFQRNRLAACSYTDDQLARIQETFRELYLLDKPGKTFIGEIKTHEEPDDHGNVSEHAVAFLKFAEVVRDIGKSCGGRGA
jgi:hypothetical protein